MTGIGGRFERTRIERKLTVLMEPALGLSPEEDIPSG